MAPKEKKSRPPQPGVPLQETAELIREIRELEARVTELKRELLQSAIPASERFWSDSIRFVLLHAGDDVLALPVGYLQEIVPVVALTPLPEAPPAVAGLLNYHGEMLAVINLGELVGEPIDPLLPDKTLAICSLEGFGFALLVDEATDVVVVDRDRIRVSEQIMPGAIRALGVFDTGDRTAVVLDIWSLVLAVQLQGGGGGEAARRTDGPEPLEPR